MPEVATIQVERVQDPRPAGKATVYNFKPEGQDDWWAAFNKVGKTIAAVVPATITVEYELRPKNGYNNPTVLNILATELPETPIQEDLGPDFTEGQTRADAVGEMRLPTSYRNPASPDEQKSMHRSVAFKGAIDLYTAAGDVKGTLEDVIAIAELTDGLLDVVEGTFTVDDDGWGVPPEES